MRKPRRQNETPVHESVGVSSSFAVNPTYSANGAVSPRQAAAPGYTGPDQSEAAPEYAGAAETVVARVRRHGRRLTFPVLILIGVAAASGYFVGTFPELWMNVLAGAGAAFLFIVGGIAPILGWLSRRVVVTTRRVIVHRGFFVRHRSEVSLARVREVRSKQNPIQRLWGSGDIDLYVGAESTRIPDAPGLKELHAAIQEISERNYDEQMRASSFGF